MSVQTPAERELEELLHYVRDNRGFDFTGYKRTSLTRRIRRRMQDTGIESFADYQDYLEVHPDEFAQLFNTILINVTSFFRDEPAWAFLAESVIPALLDAKPRQDPIRAWSVGCATGEEAYTAAMILAELLGLDALRTQVKIYATDVDEEALAEARAGTYSPKSVEKIPPELRGKYLEPRGDDLTFRKDLRRAVIFGRHDLVHDAPISRVDLIVCRNTLMYFNAEVQSKIYNGFHFALNPGGILFLGKSEMLLTRTDMFVPVDMKRRVFQRVSRRGEVPLQTTGPYAGPHVQTGDERLRAAVFDSSTVAQVVVDRQGVVAAVNSLARSELGVSKRDVGSPFHELELSYRPIELRSRIERVLEEGRGHLENAVELESASGTRYFDVEVVPVLADDEIVGVAITFADVTRPHELQSELEQSRRELETAYEEIQSTVEELETTNEELQSTNEELETTNEELQSTNEELETMNEELQSTNEELETINVELRDRTDQLNQANVFLESILGSLKPGVAVLDSDLTVRSWSNVAEDLWGVRADEARGKNVFALDIGLPVERLRPALRETVAEGTSSEVVLEATNRRGKAVTCTVTCGPMGDGSSDHRGVIVLMEVLEPQE